MNNNNLIGIKGWLLFYVILTLSLFVMNTVEFYILGKLITQLKLEIGSAAIYETLSYLIVNMLSVVSLLVLINRKKFAPTLIIIVEAIGMLVAIINFTVSDQDASEFMGMIFAIIIGATWMFYFTLSKRVRNTFSVNSNEAKVEYK